MRSGPSVRHPLHGAAADVGDGSEGLGYQT